ncbi:MAG: type I-E CRISPR-associated protein Cse1/CasA [Gammaproteobacteria bacterium]|nr:type I-E CRISPR-associated protein Cse1/CasA [Gammaproteobacteria bacterium]MCF6259846.1 type I-E CRISPR-associated protein Cse1/CasA [Gammaproteobacteria bacterium]
MSQFNLVDEKWIPVRFLDGTRDELGISDVLLKSKEIESIEDSSPLVVAALYRFLLAVLYRALEGPTDIDQAKDLFRDGLPSDKISAYLEKWNDRFWLLDEKHPFGQVPTFAPKKWRSWTALAVEYNADTAKVLFDHANENDPGRITMAATARWLLAAQTFAVSTGKSEISHTGTAPSAGSVMGIPVGLNLEDTLIFCLVPQNRMVLSDDLPLWEREPDSLEYLKKKIKVPDEKSGKFKDRTVERVATGIVDLYTWRTCSVIFKEPSLDLISDLGFASGVGYKEMVDIDPMLAYMIREVKDKGSKEKIKKKFSIQFEERGIWRDFDSLLPDETSLAPKVIEHAIRLTKKEHERFPKGVIVLGQKYFPPRPNVEYWRKEYFTLPEALSGNQNVRHEIHEILQDAKKSGVVLKASCESFARDMIGHGKRKVEQSDIDDFVTQLTVLPYYWSTLESKFHNMLREYGLDRDSDDVRHLWLISVCSVLKSAWNQHSASVSTGDAWAIRALVKAEGRVLLQLKKLRNEISILKPVEVSA